MIRTGVVVEVGDGVARVRPDSSPNVISGWLTVPRHAAGVKIGDPVSFAFDTKGGGILGVLDGAGAGGGVTLQQVQQMIAEARLDALMAENPVGHIRMETMNVNPATFLGFGTWVAWGQGRVPVSVAGSGTFNAVETIGGVETHRHPLGHEGHAKVISTGGVLYGRYVGAPYAYNHTTNLPQADVPASGTISWGYELGGITEVGSTLQPYITCYMWKRTA